MTNTYKKFIPLAKVDEAKREVYGIVTAEVPDKDNEVCDYETTVPYYKEWSGEMAKATDGKNLGNLREMHTDSAVGKGIDLEFRDADKAIAMGFKVVDDNAWNKVQEGVYTGFSQGGSYVKKWEKGDLTYYTASPAEISLVDNPCLGAAHFEYVKADGSTEMRKFMSLEKEAKTKRVGGKDLPASDFAYVGDPEKTATWKLPIHDASHVRNALARFNQTEGIPADEKSKVKARIVAAAKKFGIEVSAEKAMKSVATALDGLKKDMYSVSQLAQVVQTVAWLRDSCDWESEIEQDDSPLPDALNEHVKALSETLKQMVEEETSELIAGAEAGEKEGQMTMSNKAEFVKAAKTALEHCAKAMEEHEKAKKGMEEVAKCHKAAGEHLERCQKACQKAQDIEDERAEDEKEKPEDKPEDEEKSKKSVMVEVAKTYTEADLQKAVDAAVLEIAKALKSESKIGDRKDAPTSGPVIKVTPVTKEQDSTSVKTEVVKAEEIDMKKVMNNDIEEIRKFMSDLKPEPVPEVLFGRLSKL